MSTAGSREARGELRNRLTAAYGAYLDEYRIAGLSIDQLRHVDSQFRAGFLDGYLRLGPVERGDVERHAYLAGHAAGMAL